MTPSNKMTDLNGKRFASLNNSRNGEVGSETFFKYHEDGKVVWATYSGGTILRGNMIGIRTAPEELELRYQHVNEDGRIKTGVCNTTIQLAEDGRLLLREKWRWTRDDCSEGESTLIEMPD